MLVRDVVEDGSHKWLPQPQKQAVSLLMFEIRTGRRHPATSALDLTVEQLTAEMQAGAWSEAKAIAARLRQL